MKSNKLIFIAGVILFIATSLQAQIGIGTTNPDVSSALDITSTTQGILTPRMTTAQRTAIATPAKGLMVFDTVEAVFYFYDGTGWLPLEGAEKRNNYKLVQSDLDLADELAAGGSVYLLDENTLYEINGTIMLAAPIDINGAYVFGADGNEDVLVRVGGVIFSGNKGGGIKGVTLTAPGAGGAVFNMTGDGTENVIFRDCAVVNSGSVGTITNYNIVFLDVIQFVGNTTGITYTDIKQLLLNSTAWDGNNLGVYETYVGTFDILTKQGGYCKVDGATAAIDVTGVTSIIGSGGIQIVDFFGGGNYIIGNSPYAGYNFTNDRSIRSPGIPAETDDNAQGDFSLDVAVGSGFTTTFTGTGASSRTKLNGITVGNDLFRFVSSGNNRLVYDGSQTRYFKVNVSLSFQGNSNNDIFIFYIAKGNSGDPTATVDVTTKVYREVGSNFDIGSVPILGSVELSPGDFIEVWGERWIGSGNIVVISMNMVAN
ncbi:hypothetical protein [Lacinutrix sp. Hel_I_90]|uniref:hypothetical protein n=1 Tax=Lacinutrix sp. Hel_I_90 TaxID=1249999 RepID=UPI0005C92B42|nr:hypothetical protein [Lacinutrix sp. Hel_I_90]